MNPNTFPKKGNLILAKNSLAQAKQGYVLLDKKRSGDGITFVFCERPGRCLLRRMPFDELRALTARTFGA